MSSSVHQPPPTNALEDLIKQMESLRGTIKQQAEPGRKMLRELPPERIASAENLLYYLALRSQDIRPLQDRLTRVGLSSLGRIEPHVLATINAVLRNLYLVSGQKQATHELLNVDTAFDEAAQRLEQNTARLLGEQPEKRRTHIMVTMPIAAADDFLMVHQLLKSGMNCMRINCAHGDPETWSGMIQNLHDAERASGKTCRILMDLGGPKLRLGPMEPVPSSLRIKPQRAANGHVLRPARIWLAPRPAKFPEMTAADAGIGVDTDWLAAIQAGDRVRFRDVRGSRRVWRIREVAADGCWAEAKKTCYLANGTVLHLDDRKGGHGRLTEITDLAPQDSVCLIRTGDVLLLSATDKPGKPAVHDSNGELLNPGKVSLTIPEVYRDVRVGEPIFFDDGRISGIVEKCKSMTLQIRITHTQHPVEKLEGNRGGEFPRYQPGPACTQRQGPPGY